MRLIIRQLKFEEIAYYFWAFIGLITFFQVILLEMPFDDTVMFQLMYFMQYTLIYGLMDLVQVIVIDGISLLTTLFLEYWHLMAYLLILAVVFTVMAFYSFRRVNSRTAGVRPPLNFFNLNFLASNQVDYQDFVSQYPMQRLNMPGDVFMYSRVIDGKPVIELRDEKEGLGRCSVCRLVIKVQDHAIMCPSCRNYAHLGHLKEWLKVKKVCPICREKIVIVDLKVGDITEGADFTFITKPIEFFPREYYQDTDSMIISTDDDADLDMDGSISDAVDNDDLDDLELNDLDDDDDLDMDDASRAVAVDDDVFGDLDDISQDQADEILKKLFPAEDEES